MKDWDAKDIEDAAKLLLAGYLTNDIEMLNSDLENLDQLEVKEMLADLFLRNRSRVKNGFLILERSWDGRMP